MKNQTSEHSHFVMVNSLLRNKECSLNGVFSHFLLLLVFLILLYLLFVNLIIHSDQEESEGKSAKRMKRRQ